MDFSLLKKNLKKDFTGFKKINLAVLSDFSTQYLVQAIRAYGYEKRMDVQVWEADYDAIDLTINNGSSPLYTEKNDYVALCFSTQKLLAKYYETSNKTYYPDRF